MTPALTSGQCNRVPVCEKTIRNPGRFSRVRTRRQKLSTEQTPGGERYNLELANEPIGR
jgi:hypothetical protein